MVSILFAVGTAVAAYAADGGAPLQGSNSPKVKAAANALLTIDGKDHDSTKAGTPDKQTGPPSKSELPKPIKK